MFNKSSGSSGLDSTSLQLCAITDRRTAPQPLLRLVEGWASGGVHFIQLREKDLDAPALRSLARALMGKIDRRSKLLVNVSTHEAAMQVLAAGADGVHLAGKPAPGAASSVRQAFRSRAPLISVPCHSLGDIEVAANEKVDLMLFSPVFEKLSSKVQGLEGLRLACLAARGIPLFALGGVSATNAADCIGAGADGVAGIRLFAGDDWRLLPTAN